MNNTTDYIGAMTQDKSISELIGVTSSMEVIIDPKTMSILKILFYYALQIPMLGMGIVTNILVIITFIKCGLGDSVTVSFFALAISDLGYCTIYFALRFSSMLQIVIPYPLFIRVDLLAYVLSHYAMLFNDISILVTVFTALQKCCCVAIPHLFKTVFTPKRAVAVVIVINCSLLCLYIPMNQALRLKPTFFASTNRTVVYLHVLPIYPKVHRVWQGFNRSVMPMTAQGIILICLCIMSYKLRQSVKFRSVPTDKQETTKTTESNRLGPKEARALAAVTAVSAIFVLSTTPGTIFYYFQTIFQVLSQPRFKNVQALLLNSQNILLHANAAINLFVYLKFNTKFEDNFQGLCDLGRCRKIQSEKH